MSRGGGCTLRNSRAIVLRQCGQCRRADRMKEGLIRAQTTRSNNKYFKGQPPPYLSFQGCKATRNVNPQCFKPRVTVLETSPLLHCPSIDSPCECAHNNPDSLDSRLFPFVVLAVAPAVTMDEASSLMSYFGSTQYHSASKLEEPC